MFAQIISGIMLVFVILLFAVILIVVGHSISTGIELDYTNLGILKAIGFSKSKLRRVFIFEYILAELAGFMIGIVGSIPAVYYLNIIFVRMTGLLSSVRPAFVTCLMLLAAVLLLSTLYVFVKTGAIAKVSPIRAISGGRDSIYYHSRVEIPIEGNGLHLKMAFRQLTSNLRQYISSTIIVALLVYFLVTITLLGTSFDEQTIENCFGVVFADVSVDYNPKLDKSRDEIAKLRKQVETDISGISPIEESIKIGTAYFSVNGDEYHSTIYEDPTIVKSVLKGRVPLYDNEIAVTQIVAEELGIHIGDTVTVGNNDLEAEYIISGFIQSTNDLGKETMITYEGVKKLAPDYNMDYVDYKLKDPEKSAEVESSLVKKYGKSIDAEDQNSQDDFGDTIINAMTILNFVIYTISVLFAFIVILIVCGKVFLKERMDYGIYKALGFTTFSLRLQFALRFAMVALIGGLLGLGLNLCLNNAMMSVLLRNVGITKFVSAYNSVSVLLPIAVLTFCFFLFAYLISGRIKRVDTKNLICND
jgi:ABC-type lipoprotein release transport system permease subunit